MIYQNQLVFWIRLPKTHLTISGPKFLLSASRTIFIATSTRVDCKTTPGFCLGQERALRRAYLNRQGVVQKYFHTLI